MLTRLVYVSSAVRPFGADDLLQIVQSSRRNNAAVGVTGALLYHEGNVMQVLEGEPDAVGAVYDRVATDLRHQGVMRILREEAEERDFPDWSMGLCRPEDVPDDGVVSLFDVATPGPARARRMLHTFRTVVGPSR